MFVIQLAWKCADSGGGKAVSCCTLNTSVTYPLLHRVICEIRNADTVVALDDISMKPEEEVTHSI